jgi:hypothetical protein
VTCISAILEHWVYKHGTPVHLLSDNGPQFTAHVFHQFINKYGMHHKHTTPYHPQSNGMLERLHRFIKQRIVCASIDAGIDILNGETWVHFLAPIIFSYNATINRMTGYAPHELIFGRSPRFPIDLALNLDVNDIECHGNIHGYISALAAHQRLIFNNVNVVQDKYDIQRKKYFDVGRSDVHYEIGDIVTYHNVSGKKGKRQKFTKKWFGIWRVIALYRNALKMEEIYHGFVRKVNFSHIKRVHWHMNQDI